MQVQTQQRMVIQQQVRQVLPLFVWGTHRMSRPNHIENALVKLHPNQWFTWTDSKNKVYANLRLTDKVGINVNAKYHYIMFDGESTSAIALNFGVSFAF